METKDQNRAAPETSGGFVTEAASQVVERDGALAILVPADVAARYHLTAGVALDVAQLEDGILFTPLGVEAWFSPEWEHALELVLEHYREALEALHE